MLALWVPVTLHCALERLPGLHWLECCCAGDAAERGPSRCEQQSCGSLEAGAVKIAERLISAPAPLLVLLPAAAQAAELESLAGPVRASARTTPPALIRCWQFAFRAARPPRAPSYIS